ncbi:Lyar, partial [Symbiodinium microadriaticum]
KAKTSPQDAWAETIQSAAAQAASAPQHIRSYVLQLAECPNVPRNEKKFINFAKNSLRIHSPATLQAIWDFVASKKENASQEPAKDANDEVTEKTSVGEVESAKHEPSGSEPTEPAVETKKKKKKKDKNGEGVITATEPMVTCTSNGNEVSESKKEKKSKKRKVTELESTVSGGPSGSQSCEVEEKKTKKKKKDKQRKQTTM